MALIGRPATTNQRMRASPSTAISHWWGWRSRAQSQAWVGSPSVGIHSRTHLESTVRGVESVCGQVPRAPTVGLPPPLPGHHQHAPTINKDTLGFNKRLNDSPRLICAGAPLGAQESRSRSDHGDHGERQAKGGICFCAALQRSPVLQRGHQLLSAHAPAPPVAPLTPLFLCPCAYGMCSLT